MKHGDRTPVPLFLEASAGRCFAMWYPATIGELPRAAWLFVPAFAEEMNFSRRAVALQARALAAIGHAVLVVDLHGCGDSDGDLADASWDGWLDDLAVALAWLRERTSAPIGLWAHRLGALLAVDFMLRQALPMNLLLWQPVRRGDAFWRQFQRMATAARALGATASDEIAGYAVPEALVGSIGRATLQRPDVVGRLGIVDIVSEPVAATDSPLRVVASEWRADYVAVPGVPFWQIHDADDNLALVQTTTGMVREWQ